MITLTTYISLSQPASADAPTTTYTIMQPFLTANPFGCTTMTKSVWMLIILENKIFAALPVYHVLLCHVMLSVGKPFQRGGYNPGDDFMSPSDVQHALACVDSHFHMIRPPEDVMPKIDWIINMAKTAVVR